MPCSHRPRPYPGRRAVCRDAVAAERRTLSRARPCPGAASAKNDGGAHCTNRGADAPNARADDHRKRRGQHSSPFGPPPDFELSVADAPRRAVVPKVSYAPRGRRRSVGVYLPVEVLRSCGTARHLSVRRSPCVASALKPESATSLRYSASRRGENRPRKAAGCVCRRRLAARWRGCAGRAAARDSVGCARAPWPVLL